MTDIKRRREAALQAVGDSPADQRRRLCGKVLNHRGEKWRCNRPPCPDCGRISGNRFAKKSVFPLAEIADPCGFTPYLLTIILAPSVDIENAGQALASAKRRAKEAMHRLALQHPTFAGWWLAGGYEMGLTRDDQFHTLGFATQETLDVLGFPHGVCGGPVWLPHLHALLVLPPGADIDLVREELRKLFAAPRQVDVRRLKGHGFAEKQIRKVVRYPFKHELRLARPRHSPVESWDAEEVTTYARWAEALSSHGYRGLRFVAVDRRFPAVAEAALDAAWGREQTEMINEDEWLHGSVLNCGEDHALSKDHPHE